MGDEKTIGEVYRLLTSIDERHGAALEELKAQAKITNGRVTTNQIDIAILKDRQSDARKVGSVWGGAAGSFFAALIYVFYYLFGGGQ